jgi:hypothetical protein
VSVMLVWEEARAEGPEPRQQHRDGYSYRCYGAGDEGWHHRRW